MSGTRETVEEMSRKYGSESAEVRRQKEPGIEKPTHHEKRVEQERSESWSSWSGASGGGGVWAGRTRHEEGRGR
jgi:hypothetical protein